MPAASRSLTMPSVSSCRQRTSTCCSRTTSTICRALAAPFCVLSVMTRAALSEVLAEVMTLWAASVETRVPPTK